MNGSVDPHVPPEQVQAGPTVTTGLKTPITRRCDVTSVTPRQLHVVCPLRSL